MKSPEREAKRRYLRQYRLLAAEVDRLENKAGYWREKAVSLTPPNLGLMGIKSRAKSDIGDYVSRFLDFAAECVEAAEAAERKRAEVENAINQIGKPEYVILLKLHYLEGLSYEETAERMGYSLHWVYHYHQEALDSLEIPAVGENTTKNSNTSEL